jgi:two-component system sensor histidine kinase FlrB
MRAVGTMSDDCGVENKSLDWQALIEHMPNGVLLVASDGRIVFANQQAFALLSAPLMQEKWSDIIQRSFEPREDDGLQVSLKDGRKIQVDLKPFPGFLGQIISLSDLTSTRLFEKERGKEQRLADMGRMLAEIAHQIRTPLSAATLYCDNLKGTTLDEVRKQKFLIKLRDCHQAIEAQIRDLLIFAKGGESVLGQSKLAKFTHDVRAQMAAKLDSRNIHFKIENNHKNACFIAHLEALKGAICNLIDNAIIANANNITLKVELIENKRLLFRLIDDGDGMSEDVQKKALQAFYTTRAKGTGLGLAVVESVINAHSGQVTLTSKLGMGCEVSLYLPYIQGKNYEEIINR